MAGSSFGKCFSISTFGESHGDSIGVVIDGCPAGLAIDEGFIQQELDRRRPGQSHITTQRKESDTVQVLSGVFEGVSLGTPICLLIKNEDSRSEDYSEIKSTYRPSHADYTWQQKYGLRDYRGGGRSSARETATRVAAGAIAKLLLKQYGVRITAYVSQVGKLKLETPYQQLDFNNIEQNVVRCPDAELAQQMVALIEDAKANGDSLGGIISCVVQGCPVGLGEPVFDKLPADLGKAMLSINAVKGFEIGSGFDGVQLPGSEHNDAFDTDANGRVITITNHSGGVQGGISNGMDIYFNVAFKPTATIMKDQQTINMDGDNTRLKAKGRHDPCVVPRAVPIVEAMAALVLADHLLRNRLSRL